MRDVATLLTLFSSPRPSNRGPGRFSVVNINPSSRRRRIPPPPRSLACWGASPGELPLRPIVVVLCGAVAARALPASVPGSSYDSANEQLALRWWT